ncbi:MAG TPA: MBL fold metallo-hydrolase, partial [Caulobacteraceae bacterium]|nr:MBL fold metallo-hydrolase [Caulobacteraceae bacterium]
PLIRRVIDNNPGPFTFTGTGTYIIGKGDVAVIDPGPGQPEHLRAILDAVAGEKVTHILITHHHLDHSPLARPLAEETGAVIYGCAVKTPVIEDAVKLEAGYDRFEPDISVCGGGTVIAGAGWTFETIATPGHTSNHICYALRQENACFTGDHIMGWSTTVVTPPDGDMGAYLASLDVIEARNFDILWPTHGPPITDVRPFIEAYREHRLDRERQILGQLAAGETKIREMVPKMYVDVDPRLYPAASHSVFAHVIELVKSGRVKTDGEPALGGEYRLS